MLQQPHVLIQRETVSVRNFDVWMADLKALNDLRGESCTNFTVRDFGKELVKGFIG